MSASGQGAVGGGDDRGKQRTEKGSGTGAALGTQVLRYSGIHGLGMVLANALTFVSTIVVANFASPAEFGRLGLLLFYAGLLTLLFTLASKQGTLKRTFGGDDDEEDDEDDDEEELSASPERSFGTGIILITLVSLVGTGLSIAFAAPLAEWLLGNRDDSSLIVYAALAGGTGAVYRVTSIAIWIERRPYTYVAVEAARPLFTLAAVVPLLVAGMGIEGAIAGMALGTALGVILSLVVLRGSWLPVFDWREAVMIYRKGAIRVPLVSSMWVVSYADIFLLSRFVDDAELGAYHLASRAAFLVAILPGGYRKALRPLQKTPMFRAVEDEYGVGTARGTQFGYFTLVLVGTLLATTVMATVIVRVAPASYADAATLIPIVAAGLVAPTAYRMLNKSVKYADKRIPFIIGAVVAMFLFIGLALILIPEVGVKGAPLAMIGAFIPPSLYIYYRSQHGRSPISMPWRQMLTCIALAVAVGLLHAELDPGVVVLEILSGLAALVLWFVLCLAFGAVPSAHRAPLVAMFKGLRAGGDGFEADAALEGLRPRERKALRRALVRNLPVERAARPLLGPLEDAPGDPRRRAEAHAVYVELLRRAAVLGGAPGLPDGYARTDDPDRDARIGAFLLERGSVAQRDQIGKRLLNDKVAESYDLHMLEAVMSGLKRALSSSRRGG